MTDGERERRPRKEAPLIMTTARKFTLSLAPVLLNSSICGSSLEGSYIRSLPPTVTVRRDGMDLRILIALPRV